jgi:TolB-like protein/DNA-binding winged helix-turn-helix (wHTH) protein/Tfp pilus assembly protein PilF
MAGNNPSRIIRFGVFEVDLNAGEVRKNGLKVKLQEQPFRVLAALLRDAGNVVTREALRRELWSTDTFVDFDHGLNAAVKRLRDALDDSAENPRFIETLPRHGYRFIMAPAPHVQPRTDHTLLKSWGLLLIVSTTLLVTLVLYVLHKGALRGERASSASEQPQVHSLAVLPLANISSDPKQEYLADGMTEALITELSRIGSLKVTSRTSVLRYKGETRKPLPQIGRELNVDAVLEGSVSREGNRVRIAAHLVHAPTDQNLMTETFEQDLVDALKMQRAVAESIARSVRVKLTAEQQSRLQHAPQVVPEAYQAYLAANHVDLGGYQGIKTSQNYLKKAIELDSRFAPAYAAMATTYILLAAQRWQAPRQVFPLARQAIHKALELDEADCEAHVNLARMSWQYDWNWQEAEKQYRRALELCRAEPGIHMEYAVFTATNGRIPEARSEVARARELDPIQAEPFVSESVINYHLRDYKALIEISRAYAAQSPNDWMAHYWLGVGYEGSGQTALAIPEYQKAVDLSGGDSDTTAALAHAYATTGQRAHTLRILHERLHQTENNYVSPYMIATVYAGLERKEEAFEYLEKAYQDRSPDLTYFLRTDLRLDGLRSDPRFDELLRRINFPE